jgi:hypothetical protein
LSEVPEGRKFFAFTPCGMGVKKDRSRGSALGGSNMTTKLLGPIAHAVDEARRTLIVTDALSPPLICSVSANHLG